jgi:hypothetical protein
MVDARDEILRDRRLLDQGRLRAMQTWNDEHADQLKEIQGRCGDLGHVPSGHLTPKLMGGYSTRCGYCGASIEVDND